MKEFTGKADPPLLDPLEALLALPNTEEVEGAPEPGEDPNVFTIFWWFWFSRSETMSLALRGRL